MEPKQDIHIKACERQAFLLAHRRRNNNSNKKISNGNRTEWSPIRSVIIRVINKIGMRSSNLFNHEYDYRPNGRHEVLLPINHNFNKICDTIGYFLNQST